MKVILVLLDGLNDQVSQDCMGFLSSLCTSNKGHSRTIESELPSLSRPLYECILTGKSPLESGIFNNKINRLSTQKSIFHYVKEQEKTSAAAAYYWISELYNRSPFIPSQDRSVIDQSLLIPYAHFYFEDHYPDSHLFLDGESLRTKYNPDFLFIHSMNIDDAGHKHGLDSTQYRNSARQADTLLSALIPQWIEENYLIFITSDHGMNKDHSHGGTLPEERQVPLYIIGNHHEKFKNQTIAQKDICNVICQLI